SDLDVIVVKARRLARANAVSDSIDVVDHCLAPDEEWTLPPVEAALRRLGGVDGIISRAHDFLIEADTA
ncbi:MAG: hypothetical protein WEA81_07215, partial [Dehalococcoidia bacterium]